MAADSPRESQRIEGRRSRGSQPIDAIPKPSTPPTSGGLGDLRPWRWRGNCTSDAVLWLPLWCPPQVLQNCLHLLVYQVFE
ncbi:hypothetical protein IEQ34_014609 [Dendrobium chrysotoxum]|uniref:Uncharacterized protein n=1 Tax=Dendrobium chrysotoxum TaxID=161865 RepID=A0AAV7GKE1_DENCH|nr:hypothetical protein IEQ34_014609 [Dendrobium chrysotoxum]